MWIAPFVILVGIVTLLTCGYLVRRNWIPPRREIPAYQKIHAVLAQATEIGQPVHLSLGLGSIHDGSTLETLPGFTVLEMLSEQTAVTTKRPLISTTNPATMALAQDVMRHTLSAHAQFEPQDALAVRFIGGQSDNINVSYAAGVIDLLEHEPLAANITLGRFNDDYLLIGEVSRRKAIPQIAGSTSLSALPFMHLSSEQVLIGEELFAADAYLRDSQWHTAGLLAQDVLRWGVIISIGLLMALKTLGLN